ncbi:hypothetical protein EX30DRAFT_16914 [Ascodesmis nigricans]|uniref:Uncharacterized protein n=1 Tax=Ascodesmis nigricans TaxID=341454 RepID=A0A4S2N766_9PEZI|nr:hypothetical protein EX30DRAFT_16914 [Ascodesmis nigricans]
MSLAPPPRSSSSSTTPPPPSSTTNASSPPSTTSVSRPPAKSHQSGTIEHHWNDLPTSFLPSSRTTSRSVSPLPPTTTTSSTTTTPPPASSSTATTFSSLLSQLFTTSPSSLGAKERQLCYARITKVDADITEAQKEEVGEVVRRVLEGMETPAWGRERLVAFMLREKGVAVWAAGVRRGVESVAREE